MPDTNNISDISDKLIALGIETGETVWSSKVYSNVNNKTVVIPLDKRDKLINYFKNNGINFSTVDPYNTWLCANDVIRVTVDNINFELVFYEDSNLGTKINEYMKALYASPLNLDYNKLVIEYLKSYLTWYFSGNNGIIASDELQF